MANWTVSHKARVTIREKNGYVGGTSYWGTAESIDIVFDQMDDEPFDCSDEDKIRQFMEKALSNIRKQNKQ